MKPSYINPIHVQRRGPFYCEGATVRISCPQSPNLTAIQAAWMLENKPLYYTGKVLYDITHLPQHLRHV